MLALPHRAGTNGSHVDHMSEGTSPVTASPSVSVASTASSPYANTVPPPSLAASCNGQGPIHQPAHAATPSYSLSRPSAPSDPLDPLQHRPSCSCGGQSGHSPSKDVHDSRAVPSEQSRRSENGTAARVGAASVPASVLVTMSVDGEDEAPPPITLNGKPVTLRSAFWALLGVTEPRLFRRGGAASLAQVGGRAASSSAASTSSVGKKTEGTQLTRSSRNRSRHRGGGARETSGKQSLGGYQGANEAAAVPSMLASSTDEGSAGYRGVASTLDRLMKRLTFPAGFPPITDAEEEVLVARAAASPEAYLALFRAYGAKDPATFVRYARVLCHGGK